MEEKRSVTEIQALEQLGILVLDGSGSMSDVGESGNTKAAEVNYAVQGLIGRLKESTKKKNFLLALITYDDKVNKERLKPTPVLEIPANADYNPLEGHGGETAIGDALEAAYEIAEEFLSKQTNLLRKVVIILMTDGKNTTGSNPIETADKIKNSGKNIPIYVAGYGKSEDIDGLTLLKIVSGQKNIIGTGERGYVRAYDPEALRNFFEASMRV